MANAGKKKTSVHFRTPDTEVGNTSYLCLGLGPQGGVPFEFATAPPSNDAFGNLEQILYTRDEKLELRRSGFYVPRVPDEATFVYDAGSRMATVFQVTVGKEHSVNNGDLEWLKESGVGKVNYVGVTPVGQTLVLSFDPEWVGFVENVYQLPLEPETLSH